MVTIKTGSALTVKVHKCEECDKYHLPDTPCKDTRKPGDPQSETHGIQAVKRYVTERLG